MRTTISEDTIDTTCHWTNTKLLGFFFIPLK